jgi:hypothetical protein
MLWDSYIKQKSNAYDCWKENKIEAG